jgi:cellulose synthase/poly-beta-1,6-N-acetylglucosamine synthase-like glycosyltransferase
MIVITILFWLSAFCVIYTYAGYPLVLMAWNAVKQPIEGDADKVGSATSTPLPSVAVLVAAHNEERHIAERVRNLMAQNYPPELLHVYIGSDASTDLTEAIMAELVAELGREFGTKRLHFTPFAQRRGKPSVVNDLAAIATEDILVFTDANTFFEPDTARNLVRHFAQTDVGCVCGELRLVSSAGDNQDHIYWRYERMLKFFENRIQGLLGANGGVYALRRRDYTPIPASTIVDDFWVSMQVIESGLRCVYDTEAVATETTPERVTDEFKRRVRIGKGNYQALVRFVGLLHPQYGVLAFTFLSHKVLRWLAPHCMVLALLCNALLAGQGVYTSLLAAQVAFYASAAAGWRCAKAGVAPRWLRLPLFFVSMNLGLLLGFYQFIQGKSSGAWARSAR